MMRQLSSTWKKLSNLIKIILSIYAICFLFGGLRHWLDIFYGGIFPYKNIPFIFNFYLTLLAILDLIVIALIFSQPIYGLLLAILIMVSDLLVDFYVGYFYWNTNLVTNVGLQLLLGFGLFVFVSAPFLIRWMKNNTKRN